MNMNDKNAQKQTEKKPTSNPKKKVSISISKNEKKKVKGKSSLIDLIAPRLVTPVASAVDVNKFNKSMKPSYDTEEYFKKQSFEKLTKKSGKSIEVMSSEPEDTPKAVARDVSMTLVPDMMCGPQRSHSLYSVDIGRKPDSKDGDLSSRSLNRAAKKKARAWFRDMLDMGPENIRMEYKTSPPELPKDLCKVFLENQADNRYGNIGCLDSTRVEFASPKDYIHANYIRTATSHKRFIATQAPFPQTCERFWRMIINDEAEVIVMLCQFIEKGKEKSFEYFPPKKGQTKEFPQFTIVNKGYAEVPTVNSNEIRVSLLNIIRPGHPTLLVRHYHWLNWPDHGVPTSPTLPITLLKYIRVSKKPIVIHCSAGIGRTGTLVLMEMVLEHINGPNRFDGVGPILDDLRSQRLNCVQNDNQFLYVHRCIMEYFSSKKLSKGWEDEYTKFCNIYEVIIKDDKPRKKKKKSIEKFEPTPN